MPLRFYCPFCNKLLSIGRRKSGNTITCPGCRGVVGVPGKSSEEDHLQELVLEEQPTAGMMQEDPSDPLLTMQQILILSGVLLGILVVVFLVGLILGVLF